MGLVLEKFRRGIANSLRFKNDRLEISSNKEHNCKFTNGSSKSSKSVVELLHTDREFLIYGLWVATIGCLSGALLFAALSAVFAVINTASSPSGAVTGVPGLYLWNTLAMFFNLSAVSLWAVQFYQKLQYNVMSLEDRGNMWSSTQMSAFGYSFWFVVGAVVVHFINIVVIYIGTSEAREKKIPQPMIEEKSNGAIMLY